MYNIFKGKTVLITGGTGSFGKNFVKFLLTQTAVVKVIIFSRDEYKQSRLQSEIIDDRVRFFLGDVRDLPRLQRAFKGVDIVVHAAALKQVPALEYNPFEAVKTNITGTQNVIEAAIDQGVSRVLLISTDKAAQPANLYGATKLCAEKLIVAANSYSPGKTRFSAVRYGNVVGSRGSVIDILKKSKKGEKVPLTHPDMTRFYITLRQSFELVSFAFTNMEGGEIFLPQIPSMKTVDLFNCIVPDALHEVIGVRPGEKIHEDLITVHEARRCVELKNFNYFVLLPDSHSWGPEDPYQKYRDKGTGESFPDGLSSNNNTTWLAEQDLKIAVEMLDDLSEKGL
jgi:UDP-N-acetylglucosamine 4,6-dehydratase/5-epimerase